MDYMNNLFSNLELLMYLTKSNQLLLDYQTKYEGHATWPSTQENEADRLTIK
jgi:hypothetical protein